MVFSVLRAAKSSLFFKSEYVSACTIEEINVLNNSFGPKEPERIRLAFGQSINFINNAVDI